MTLSHNEVNIALLVLIPYSDFCLFIFPYSAPKFEKNTLEDILSQKVA